MGKEVVYYIPIFQWSELPNSVHGMSMGCQTYYELKDLYGHNPDAIGFFEVSGYIPTKEEFDNRGTINN